MTLQQRIEEKEKLDQGLFLMIALPKPFFAKGYTGSGFQITLKSERLYLKLPPIYLGYGSKDRLIKGQELLASLLPNDRVFTLEGDHKFTTFAQLWNSFLDRSILQQP